MNRASRAAHSPYRNTSPPAGQLLASCSYPKHQYPLKPAHHVLYVSRLTPVPHCLVLYISGAPRPCAGVMVADALDQHPEGCTVIMLAHGLSSLRFQPRAASLILLLADSLRSACSRRTPLLPSTAPDNPPSLTFKVRAAPADPTPHQQFRHEL